MNGNAPLPVLPIPGVPRWTEALTRLAAQPLEFCPDLPRIAERLEAWWAHDCLDRPVFLGTANKNAARRMTRRLELLDQPEAWFDAKLADMQQTYHVGDAIPAIRVDFGPVMLGGLLGGKTEFLADTTWTHCFINDDWSNAPTWKLDESHPWWGLMRKLLCRVADDAKGRYAVCTPNIDGPADILLNLRGASELCMDILEQPQRITAALDAIYPAWVKATIELYRCTVERGAGVVHWLGLWSNRPYFIPACDFNYMVGPEEFNRHLLPDIARHAATVGRGVFHLDGPGAARHIDALLEVSDIQAIQFTPGEGTPSTLPWIEMFRKIQSKGRSVLAITPADEVLTLCDELHPEGLAILTSERDPRRLDELFDGFCREFEA